MRSMLVLLVVVSLGLASEAPGGQGSKSSSDSRQEILNYQLTLARANQLITAMDAMTKYMVSRPDFHDLIVKSAKMTPDERRAQVERDPKAMAILKQNGLTAQDYLVGVPTLRMALMVAQGIPNGGNITASPANVAFAKANLSQLKPKMDAADGVGAQK
jgi:hypothetical protein